MPDRQDSPTAEIFQREKKHRRRRPPLLKRLDFSVLRRAATLKTLESAAHLSAVVALIGLFIQLYADARNRRSQIALSYVQSYNSEPISTHRHRLDKMWLDRRPEVQLLNKTGGLTREGTDRLVAFIISKADDEKSGSPVILSIQEMASFYDQIAICVQQSLCDEEIMKPYFYQNMREFWNYYQGTIRAMRPAVSQEFGAALERQVSRMP